MLGPWMLLLGTLILSSGCKKPGDLPAGPDAATGAKTTATTGATAVEKKFKVAISTRPGQWNLDERVRGYKETFEKEYPEIEVVAEIDDETKYEVGTREASAVLEKFQDLAGFAGINAASGPGVAKAVENAGRSGKVVVVAMDADSPVLDAIEAGTIQASVAQRQYYMTYLGVKYLYGLKHKLLRAPDDQSADSRLPAIAAEVDTGTVEVTKENVVVFRTPSQGAKEDIKKTHPEWVRLLSDRKVVGDTSNEEYVVIGISTGVEYWNATREGLKDVCAELGVKPRFTGPEDQNPEKQAEELDNVIARKPAGILIAPGNPETLKPYIDRAIEEGINVICIDTDSPKSRRLAYVGTSNYQAGVMGAHIMAKALGAKRAGERADDASGADSSGSL